MSFEALTGALIGQLLSDEKLHLRSADAFHLVFLGFSYGFRPGRGQHDALDALAYGIKGRNVRWIFDADIPDCRKEAPKIRHDKPDLRPTGGDIRSVFDRISHDWLIRFVEYSPKDQMGMIEGSSASSRNG